jgi:hypothetical protein
MVNPMTVRTAAMMPEMIPNLPIFSMFPSNGLGREPANLRFVTYCGKLRAGCMLPSDPGCPISSAKSEPETV